MELNIKATPADLFHKRDKMRPGIDKQCIIIESYISQAQGPAHPKEFFKTTFVALLSETGAKYTGSTIATIKRAAFRCGENAISGIGCQINSRAAIHYRIFPLLDIYGYVASYQLEEIPSDLPLINMISTRKLPRMIVA